MTAAARRAAWLSTAALAALLGACAAKPPKPSPPATLSMAAREDVNPDPSGRPAPVVVRVYQLRGDSAFLNSDFFPLFDDDRKVLAADLVGREEEELSPSEIRRLDLILAPDTRFLGAVAAYRNIRNATWRALVPAPMPGSAQKPVKVTISVVAERSRVTLEVRP